ncbi:2-acylglycerol O-acyltransferase 1-like isoform X2 [Neocloeon triangulifer]|uniref:2-acylglycerol O-acyltransferase 1-like isoform X2 n=1 Tax=Neocloeon triangulifer TaxID=2078957 RepID=UPI00286F8C5B|nr:2-acylglycerol O-acyltransferase 1-like isoform X2 [Neocloeon triangulifer]
MANDDMGLLQVQFAPLNTPFIRRMQTLAAAGWIMTFVFGGFFFSVLLFYMMICTRLWWLVFLYILWILIDKNTSKREGRRIEWVRDWTWWRLYRAYFPLSLERTVELPSDRNYLFACYPHGVLCSGLFGNFVTKAPEFEKLFPGLTPTVHTLDGNFSHPVIRDLILSLGLRSSSREAILYNLCSEKKGQVSVLAVGGAAEALKSKPGVYNIILKPRKGFVKCALISGATLVPVFSFGETDLYNQLDNPEGSLLRRVQERLRKIIGIAPVVFLGRGMFQYSFGLVPQRRNVTTVVGKPIELPKVVNPSPEEVEEYHTKFTAALIDLFESNKHRLLSNPNVMLKID